MTKFHRISEGTIVGDDLKLMLTNVEPTLDSKQFDDLVEIAAGNGYPPGGMAAEVSGSHIAAVVLVAAGPIGPFRYIVLYAPVSGNVLGWWDFGAAITLAETEAFTLVDGEINAIT